MLLSTPVKNVIRLSIPAILAELSSTLMQYIDASMVGSLGKVASASIGLVASSTWLINGIGMACATGFAVQVAQKIGADQKDKLERSSHPQEKRAFCFRSSWWQAGSLFQDLYLFCCKEMRPCV